MISRRMFLAAGGALAPAATAWARGAIKIGVTDWNLRQAGRIEALALAKSIGFEGVEVSLGRQAKDNKLPLDNPELIARYVAESKKVGIELSATCLDILHVNYLKNDKLGQKWLGDGIRLTKALKTRVMLMPFFGKGALTNRQEMDYVADILKEFGKEAEKAGVILGLENTISAEDNARIMERSGSKAVKVFYDVGNSTNNGFDIYKEMRWLGAKRICLVHLKDKGYLGEGTIDFVKVFKILRDIGYKGFADLETSSPSKSIEADMKRNLAFVRRVMSQKA